MENGISLVLSAINSLPSVDVANKTGPELRPASFSSNVFGTTMVSLTGGNPVKALTVTNMERRTTRHHWTEQDDIVALYFYKFGDQGRTSSITAVGERRGMGAGSLRMRVGNFRAIAGGGRLDHATLQSREIYRRYATLSEPELRKLAGL